LLFSLVVTKYITKQIITILNLNIMRTPEFYIETKKTGAGHYLVTVTDEANNEIKSYTETDMQLIDALNEDGDLDMTQWDATQIVIRKAGFDN
jgi:hypothetical protein